MCVHASRRAEGCHLLDAIKLMQPGCVLSAWQRVLTLQAVMAVLQPRLQLLALSAESQLHMPLAVNAATILDALCPCCSSSTRAIYCGRLLSPSQAPLQQGGSAMLQEAYMHPPADSMIWAFHITVQRMAAGGRPARLDSSPGGCPSLRRPLWGCTGGWAAPGPRGCSAASSQRALRTPASPPQRRHSP